VTTGCATGRRVLARRTQAWSTRHRTHSFFADDDRTSGVYRPKQY